MKTERKMIHEKHWICPNFINFYRFENKPTTIMWLVFRENNIPKNQEHLIDRIWNRYNLQNKGQSYGLWKQTV